MPADPTENLGSRRLETKPDYIGHVAPDFDDRKHFNTLVVRPTYRISLRLGPIDHLCADDPDTDPGRRTRLQLLAYLYEPLSSANQAKADAARDVVWNWYTTKLNKTDDDLKKQLEDDIVEKNQLPAPDSFTKIYFPGGYCYDDSDEGTTLNGGDVGGDHPKFVREKAVWDANPVLGAIPIIAKVEKRVSNRWEAVKDVWVYLQLIKPDDLPNDQKPAALRNGTSFFTPTPASSPQEYVVAKIANPDGSHPIVADDPQVNNAHDVVGGKRGLSASGHVFEIDMDDGTPRKGFYTAHAARNPPDGKPFFDLPDATTWFNKPEQAPADGTKHLHAVRAKTLKNGEAGFIFKPSRMGGDRYKLRAYIGPKGADGVGLASDGTDPQAVKVDTGTFVIWRRMRLDRLMYWDYPGAAPAVPPAPRTTWPQKVQFRASGPLPVVDFNVVAVEYRKAYLDVVVESTAARQQLTGAEWTNARNYAVTELKKDARFSTIDIETLLPSSNTSFSLLYFRSASDYNSHKGATFAVLPTGNNYWSKMNSIAHAYKNAFLKYFTRNALPFTVIHAPYGENLTYDSGPSSSGQGGYIFTSGWASPVRGAVLFWGQALYTNWTYPKPNPTADQGASYNTIHEVGHCHYGAHHWTARSAAGVLSGGSPAEHDQKDYCIMGYVDMEGDFCGRCILKHRGWNTKKLA